MSGNPIVRIDPNGADDDWYQSEGGSEPIWNEGSAATIDIDGETYKNIGEKGHDLENYYHSDGTKTPVSFGLNEATVDGGTMSDHARTMSNPVVQNIHQGQVNFMKGAASVTGEALGTVGSATSLVGYGVSFVPGAQPVGAALLTLGIGLSTTGGLFQSAFDFSEGNNLKGAIGLGAIATGFGATRAINKTSFSNLEKTILIGSTEMKITILNTTLQQKAK
ncbi:MAG: hypothetical protein H0V01_05585 [Bacteroidetes bacterium]|nr:hypothetical protein [Bacteroidota bacterium]HET6244382.1 hypothetical protein [Bacteroidia bacterium]